MADVGKNIKKIRKEKNLKRLQTDRQRNCKPV